MSACGSSGSSKLNKNLVSTENTQIDSASIAIKKIKAYADNNNSTTPTVQDYLDAGVVGVTSKNIDALNSLVANLEAKDVDTKEELNALIKSLNELGVNLTPAFQLDDNTTTEEEDDKNTAPIANSLDINILEDSKDNSIKLTGTDKDGDSLTYIITDIPNHGKLEGKTPNLTYIPDSDYFGDDIFSFKVNDGTIDSAVVDVVIHIKDVPEPTETRQSGGATSPTVKNKVPTANSQNIVVKENSKNNSITLTGDDADGDTLKYIIEKNTAHGVLNGTENTLVYTPNQDYNGTDSFSFKVNDGKADSAVVDVNIIVSLTSFRDDFSSNTIANYNVKKTESCTIGTNIINNSSFEDANLSDWIQTKGTAGITRADYNTTWAGTPKNNAGRYFAYVKAQANDETTTEVQQTINISGCMNANTGYDFSALLGGWADDDTIAVTLDFQNENNQTLNTYTTGDITDDKNMSEYTNSDSIDSNVTKVTVKLTFKRIDPNDIDGYIDNLSIVITDPTNSVIPSSFTYDNITESAFVHTGRGKSLTFSKTVMDSTNGEFSIDFKPTEYYDLGGNIKVRLVQNQDNYYEIYNTYGSGYKVGYVQKIVNGKEADSAVNIAKYDQNTDYNINIKFSPSETTFIAFGETLIIDTNNSNINVNSFDVELEGQDAYFDNIKHSLR